MYWPNPSDFSRILQTPRVAFRDAQLQTCQIEKNPIGQPKARSGNFATVYRGILPDGSSVAVRVFNLGRDERRERYNEIANYLKSREVGPLIQFEYHESGIRSASDGKFYPLVTMEWVEGDTLFGWLRAQCLGGESRAIHAIAEQWIDLIDELAAAQISHGDLQHGNIMVDPQGRLRLVDYDCMCVPALEGRRNLEKGLEPYQHPGRDDRTPLSLTIDRFSSLMILVALRALAAAPGLWHKYIELPSYDKLLFRVSDFDSPVTSELRHDLINSPDESVSELASALFDAYAGPLDQVPALTELVRPFEKVQTLLNARDWDQALELLHRTGRAQNVPEEMRPIIREAVDRVACRRALEHAVLEGNEIEMQRWYLPGLLDDYPAANELVAIAKNAGDVIPVLKQLRDAHKNRAWSDFIATWDANERLLSGRKSAARFHQEVEKLRARTLAMERVKALLAGGDADVDVPALATAWKKLVQLGGHPEAKAIEPHVQHLVLREKTWRRLVRLPGDVNEANDRALVETWNDELFSNWVVADAWRERYEAAAQRLAQMDRLSDVVERLSTDLTQEGEQTIIDVSVELPVGYRHAQMSRVQQAARRLHALKQLEQAIAHDGPEMDIARGWQHLSEAQAESFIKPGDRERIGLAQQRLPLLLGLRQLPDTLDVVSYDREILKRWDAELLTNCSDAQPWAERHAQACERGEILQALRDADEADDEAILAAAANPLLDGYPLEDAIAEQIDAAEERQKWLSELLTMFEEERIEAFAAHFDAAMIERFESALQPANAQLIEWTTRLLRPLESCGLRHAFQSGLVKIEKASYRLRWGWPRVRFTRQCVVTITRNEPSPAHYPEDLEVLWQADIYRDDWDRDGANYVLQVEDVWGGGYVAVWAKFALGETTVASEPLLLGQLEETRASRKLAKQRRKKK